MVDGVWRRPCEDPVTTHGRHRRRSERRCPPDSAAPSSGGLAPRWWWSTSAAPTSTRSRRSRWGRERRRLRGSAGGGGQSGVASSGVHPSGVRTRRRRRWAVLPQGAGTGRVRPGKSAGRISRRPAAGERRRVVVTKQYASAFFGTSLASTLTAMGVDTTLICGFHPAGVCGPPPSMPSSMVSCRWWWPMPVAIGPLSRIGPTCSTCAAKYAEVVDEAAAIAALERATSPPVSLRGTVFRPAITSLPTGSGATTPTCEPDRRAAARRPHRRRTRAGGPRRVGAADLPAAAVEADLTATFPPGHVHAGRRRTARPGRARGIRRPRWWSARPGGHHLRPGHRLRLDRAGLLLPLLVVLARAPAARAVEAGLFTDEERRRERLRREGAAPDGHRAPMRWPTSPARRSRPPTPTS